MVKTHRDYKRLSVGRHGFHIVRVRPWPILTAVGAYILTLGLVLWFHGHGLFHVWCGLSAMAVSAALW